MTKAHSNFHEAYVEVLESLLNNPEYVSSPRGEKTYEILNYSFVVKNPQTEIVWEDTGFPERRSVADEYTRKELDWYLSGDLDAATAPADFWRTLKDPDGNITSNYGYMTLHEKRYGDWKKPNLRTGFENVVEILKRDPDSRQAVIHYGDPRHFWTGNKDTPCCANNQFFLREGFLHMTVHMRSNDVIKGLTYDYPWFSYLQTKVAAELGVLTGPITYHAGSMHLYESDASVAKRIVRVHRRP